MKKQLRMLLAGIAISISMAGVVLVCAGVGIAVAAIAWGIDYSIRLAYDVIGWPGPLALVVFLVMLATNVHAAMHELVKDDKK